MIDVHPEVEQALRESGWLPAGALLQSKGAADLLPAILNIWTQQGSRPASQRPESRGIQPWLECQAKHGATLAINNGVSARWLGRRLMWSSRRIPGGNQIGLASSRLGRRLDTQSAWFTVFRAGCTKIDRETESLLTASDTTTQRFVARAAELFNVNVVCMKAPSSKASLGTWLGGLPRLPDEEGPVYTVYLSPPFGGGSGEAAAEECLQQHPIRDRAVVAHAHRLLVFHLRRGGHLEQLVRARLKENAFARGSVFIALGKDLVASKLADELLDAGAVGWLVLDTLAAEPAPPDEPAREKQAAILPLCDVRARPFLIHCTRAQPEGWPDQDQADRLDELILERDGADHSAFAALQRIVVQQRLVATASIVRGNTPVVSFTAASLNELPQLRTFRSHLGRWDFEPYGICIDHDWLKARGAQAVQYGDDDLWQTLPEADQPFFQLAASRSRTTGRTIDWKHEKEWRHVGDVALCDLPPDAGLVFVPNQSEAEQLAEVSRWPVTVLNST